MIGFGVRWRSAAGIPAVEGALPTPSGAGARRPCRVARTVRRRMHRAAGRVLHGAPRARAAGAAVSGRPTLLAAIAFRACHSGTALTYAEEADLGTAMNRQNGIVLGRISHFSNSAPGMAVHVFVSRVLVRSAGRAACANLKQGQIDRGPGGVRRPGGAIRQPSRSWSAAGAKGRAFRAWRGRRPEGTLTGACTTQILLFSATASFTRTAASPPIARKV